jgi:hypothetical protein
MVIPLPDEAREPVLEVSALDHTPFTLPTVTRRPVMDSLIDVIATIALDSQVGAVSGEAVLAAMPVTRRVGSKPFAIEGLQPAHPGVGATRCRTALWRFSGWRAAGQSLGRPQRD